MVAEQRVNEMESKIKKLEEKLKETEDRQEYEAAKRQKLEEALRNLEELKDDFGSRLQAKLATMDVEAEQRHGMFLNELKAVVSSAQSKFNEIEHNIKVLYADAGTKFKEIDDMINKGHDSKGKKCGFLPDKMMVPKIFADDVKCSHGCTIGQLDEDALFYLRSRGIPKKEAKGLLTYAFANNVLESVAIPALKTRINKLIAMKLGVDLGHDL